MKFLRELLAALLVRCPECWEPLACQRHWVRGIEGYGNYYCPKCSGMKGEECEDIYS